MGHRRNDDYIAWVRDRATEGLSQDTIAKLAGKSRQSVNQICKRYGIDTLSGLTDWDRRDRLVRAVVEAGEGGISITDAGKVAGYLPGSAFFALKREGLYTKKKVLIDHYRECADAKMTLSETARKFGKSVQNVWNEARRANPRIVFAKARDRTPS
jgi:AraC-like DNA-binding protein